MPDLLIVTSWSTARYFYLFITLVSFVANIIHPHYLFAYDTFILLKLCNFLIQPYNIGIVSARPFTVLAEYGPLLFQRGVLHVFYHELQLHVFIVHLHAHSSRVRIQEAKNLLEVF